MGSAVPLYHVRLWEILGKFSDCDIPEFKKSSDFDGADRKLLCGLTLELVLVD